MRRRLAILSPFEGLVAFAARHPDDGAKVAAALSPLRPDWHFDTYRVSDGQWPDDVAGHDAWVITGSPASVNDDRPWIGRLEALVRERHAQRRAMVGLCFGHQVIAKALGGRVGPSLGGGRFGTAPLQLQQPQPWMQPPQADLSLYAAHVDQVLEPAPQAVVLGGDAFCPVGACAIGTHVFTTQYHPEFSRAVMDDVLDEMAPHLPAADLARGRAQLARPVDAPLVWQWIARFVDTQDPPPR
ncbi:type 1 glutamine amidotransferase [Ideonella sp. A 288]|uniref:type 1 glutamine amidotransferase n=1 Tax=Ideonella sp. A 288 TaxID=1962181 RepID=UPI0011865204|nr:type 1 glutamine amidotransferase [Ideonella sp. A 288]